mmetsp:Transcript_35011/g.88101  ORF Transcript_35011/g.88101 Transcript_35011/m.88101 type:complete len:275 (-) Transcript_35011:1070-1894(-)
MLLAALEMAASLAARSTARFPALLASILRCVSDIRFRIITSVAAILFRLLLLFDAAAALAFFRLDATATLVFVAFPFRVFLDATAILAFAALPFRVLLDATATLAFAALLLRALLRAFADATAALARGLFEATGALVGFLVRLLGHTFSRTDRLALIVAANGVRGQLGLVDEDLTLKVGAIDTRQLILRVVTLGACLAWLGLQSAGSLHRVVSSVHTGAARLASSSHTGKTHLDNVVGDRRRSRTQLRNSSRVGWIVGVNLRKSSGGFLCGRLR